MGTRKIMLVVAAIASTTLLAFGISSFSTRPIEDTTTMYYHGPTFDHDEVIKKSNWTTVSQDCEEGEDLACQVTVSNDLIQSGAFKSSVELEAEPGTASALTKVFDGTQEQYDAIIVNRD